MFNPGRKKCLILTEKMFNPEIPTPDKIWGLKG
jgi:hypothetical protein